jgi:hypothetical protein
MSTVFQSVICAANPQDVTAVSELWRSAQIAVAQCAPALSAVFATGPRDDTSFFNIADSLAQQLSLRFGHALIVVFDDRTGTRVSSLFRDGTADAEFGEEDELWVPLDANGHAMSNGPRLTPAQLDPDQEYETATNAIQLGLAAIGHADAWPEFRRFMSAH